MILQNFINHFQISRSLMCSWIFKSDADIIMISSCNNKETFSRNTELKEMCYNTNPICKELLICIRYMNTILPLPGLLHDEAITTLFGLKFEDLWKGKSIVIQYPCQSCNSLTIKADCQNISVHSITLIYSVYDSIIPKLTFGELNGVFFIGVLLQLSDWTHFSENIRKKVFQFWQYEIYIYISCA